MKKIYLNKDDMRSYALTPDVAWETIELLVSDDFEGGGKYYDLASQEWINDETQSLPQEEAQKRELLHEIEIKTQTLYEIEAMITRRERIKDRTEIEEQELDALIEQSTVLFREIRALESI